MPVIVKQCLKSGHEITEIKPGAAKRRWNSKITDDSDNIFIFMFFIL